MAAARLWWKPGSAPVWSEEFVERETQELEIKVFFAALRDEPFQECFEFWPGGGTVSKT
jgi:hypothetical protein